MNIFSFLVDEYPTLIRISSIWYFKIHDAFDQCLITLDNDFIKAHMGCLAFKSSYFSVTPYNLTKKKGFRMDRNITAEVLPGYEGNDYEYRFWCSQGISWEKINTDKKAIYHNIYYI